MSPGIPLRSIAFLKRRKIVGIMEDFGEEDIYGDVQYDYIDEGDNDEEVSEDEGDIVDFGFEEPVMGEEGDDGQGFITDKPGFRDMQHIGNIPTATDRFMGKRTRTPEEGAIDQARGILASGLYSELPSTTREAVIEMVRQFPHVYLYNIPTLIPAFLWKLEKKALNRKNFHDFFKPEWTINRMDLVRYIRKVSS